MRASLLRRSIAVFSVLGSICCVLAVAGPKADATTGPLVYGVNPYDNASTPVNGNTYSYKGLHPFDASTGKNAPGFVMTNVGGNVSGTILSANGLAHDPVSTNDYVVVQIGVNANRTLGTINLANGQVNTINSMGHKISAITVATDGTMYAVAGDGDGCPGCLYTVNKTTAALTYTNVQLPHDSCCGQAIGYDPVDDHLYHATVVNNVDIFEKLDRTALTDPPTSIGYTGTHPDEVYGIGFDANSGNFIMTDADKNVWSVSAGGATTLLSTTNGWLRGLIVSASPVPANSNPTAMDDSASTVRGGSITLKPLLNDTDPEDDPITFTSVTQPTHGTITQNNLILTYVPDPGYCNDGSPTDDFMYTINGGSTATVHITVLCQIRNTVFGVYPYNNNNITPGLTPFDLTTGDALTPSAISIIGGPVQDVVQGATGLAFDPRTQKTFALLKVNNAVGRVLATVDLQNGNATTIRDTKQNFSAITFTSAGVLYGVTGRNTSTASFCEACLFRINKSTGGLQLIRKVSNVASGHALVFDPHDGKLYHATGQSPSVFERIDPAHNFHITAVPYVGAAPFEPVGLGYDPASNAFVLTDGHRFTYSVTSAGVISPLGTTPDTVRGVIVNYNTVSLKYNATKHVFTGRVTSPWPACRVGRTVSIFRTVGPTSVADVVTNQNGVFALKHGASGKYYATIAATQPSGIADCPAAQSRTIAVN